MHEAGRAKRLGVYLPLKVSHSPLVWRQKSNYGQFFHTFPSGCRADAFPLFCSYFSLGRKKQKGQSLRLPNSFLGIFGGDCFSDPLAGGVSELPYSLIDAILCVGVSRYEEIHFWIPSVPEENYGHISVCLTFVSLHESAVFLLSGVEIPFLQIHIFLCILYCCLFCFCFFFFFLICYK